MTKMMDEAINVLRELPDERQDMLARAILDYASYGEEDSRFTDDERDAVRVGLTQADRGEFVSDADVRA